MVQAAIPTGAAAMAVTAPCRDIARTARVSARRHIHPGRPCLQNRRCAVSNRITPGSCKRSRRG